MLLAVVAGLAIGVVVFPRDAVRPTPQVASGPGGNSTPTPHPAPTPDPRPAGSDRTSRRRAPARETTRARDTGAIAVDSPSMATAVDPDPVCDGLPEQYALLERLDLLLTNPGAPQQAVELRSSIEEIIDHTRAMAEMSGHPCP